METGYVALACGNQGGRGRTLGECKKKPVSKGSNLIKRRLSHLPRLPHKPVRKKIAALKRGPSLQSMKERELTGLLETAQDGLRCSSNRGMISTKLQGR